MKAALAYPSADGSYLAPFGRRLTFCPHRPEKKREEKKRKDYASQVQLHALRKGTLTSKLARASPR
eukprot:1150364-Pelagomonas_calceolata.AAC.3